MAEPASTLAAGSAGSVGTVETQYLDLPDPVPLDCGRELHPVRVAYETYGTLSPRRDNVILVCHALSGDAHAAGFAKTPPEEGTRDGFGAEDRDGTARKGLGWWDGMIGPGKAFDTDRFFVVSTNLLGGCRGTTGPSSVNPATGRPYGPDFPVITVADMVRTERAFLDVLGIERLAAVAGGAFNWSNGRFPVVADPSPAYHGLRFHETFGMYGYLMKLRAETLRDLGAALSPFSAFLFLQGLETLSLRMERHVGNARAVAAFLQSHELASNVTYPGLPSSRYRPLVEKYLPRGAGAVFAFDCAGGRAGGQDLIRGVTLWSHLANVGDAKSLIIHPASTTHRQLSDDELRAAGVGPGTVRLSVGTESVEDLIWDLERGFALVAATAGRREKQEKKAAAS
jgi:hypothetical protein